MYAGMHVDTCLGDRDCAVQGVRVFVFFFAGGRDTSRREIVSAITHTKRVVSSAELLP